MDRETADKLRQIARELRASGEVKTDEFPADFEEDPVRQKQIDDYLNEKYDSQKMADSLQGSVPANADFEFVASVRGAGHVDKVFNDGRRLIGTIIHKEWVEVP